MAHSGTDSDCDSSCFHSAEENIDSPDENINSESCNDNMELTKNKFYRKRPERAKRLPVKTSSNSLIKNSLSSLNESISKTNPDTILQDFTTNLTKNFNIGFNTIQQTSSNVKEIILNKLPHSPQDEKDSFSYDEVKCETQDFEPCQSNLEIECAEDKNIVDVIMNDFNEPSLKSAESGYVLANEEGAESGYLLANEEAAVGENSFESKNPAFEECSLASKDSSLEQFSVQSKESGLEQCSVQSKESSAEQISVQSKESCAEQLSVQSKQSSAEQCSVKSKESSVDQISMQSKQSFAEQCSLKSKESCADQFNVQNNEPAADESSIQSKEFAAEQSSIQSKEFVEEQSSIQGKESESEQSSVQSKDFALDATCDQNIAEGNSSSRESTSQTSNFATNENFLAKEDSLSDLKSNNSPRDYLDNISSFRIESDDLSNFDSDKMLKNQCWTENGSIRLNDSDELFIKSLANPGTDFDPFGSPKDIRGKNFSKEFEKVFSCDTPNTCSDGDPSQETVNDQNSFQTLNRGEQNYIAKEDFVKKINFAFTMSDSNPQGMLPPDFLTEDDLSKEMNIHYADKNSEISKNSKDGWDDFEFDFNENEFDGSQRTENSKGSTWSESNKSFSSKPKVESNSSSSAQDSFNFKEKRKNFKGESKNVPVQENNSEEADWGWDNWDENENSTLCSKSESLDSGSKSEEVRWSGWESFGEKKEKSGSWSLGSWGVDAILNKATSATSVISSVIEAGLGVPTPETLAQMDKLEKEKHKEEPQPKPKCEEPMTQLNVKKSLTDGNLIGGITNLFSGVTTKIVENSKIQEIGSKVINTGLDTLEIVGKKTMEVLQEQDPGLKNKRALLMGDSKPVLSQVLREVKEKAEKEIKKAEEKEASRKCHFETLFDDYQGLIHLEALEMLSTQCKLQVEQAKNGMSQSELEEWNLTLEEVEDLCSIDDLNDLSSPIINFKIAIKSAVEPLKDEISELKIVEIHENINSWLKNAKEKSISTTELHQKAVQTIAQLTASGVHQFHEAGKLLFIKDCRKTVEEIDALSRLTEILCTEMKDLVNKFTELALEKTQSAGSSTNDEVKDKLEVVLKTSVTYLKQAFELMVPIIQLGTKL